MKPTIKITNIGPYRIYTEVLNSKGKVTLIETMPVTDNDFNDDFIEQHLETFQYEVSK